MRAVYSLLAVAIVGAAAACASVAQQAPVVAHMHLVGPGGAGADLGVITIRDTHHGVALEVNLHGLPPGDHGIHVHTNGSCEASTNDAGAVVPAGGAQGHYDPGQTTRHEGPMGQGHLGDLPLLHVDARGDARETLAAPRLTSAPALRGRALIIHANGDNYSDTPAPLGGGGARIACGVIG